MKNIFLTLLRGICISSALYAAQPSIVDAADMADALRRLGFEVISK